MGDAHIRVDGNSLAGLLGEVFVAEMTSARVSCEGCGEIEAIGAEHAYTHGPGIVLRCCHCDGVLLVITRRDDKHLLGFQRIRWLEIPGPP